MRFYAAASLSFAMSYGVFPVKEAKAEKYAVGG